MKSLKFFLLQGIIFSLILFTFKANATTWVVNVQNYSFVPSDLPDVNVGDTISWVWVSGSHTTTSTTIPAGADAWDHPINSSNTSFDYVVMVPGLYNYKCTFHEASGMVGTFTANVATGVFDPASSYIRIYPNPAKDFIRMENIPGATVTLFNTKGQILLNRESGSGNMLLNVSGFARGIYFIRISQNGEVRTQKIVLG